MATVLGLSFFYHDSAAALVRDGAVIAAAAEERFTRRKHTSEFPNRAIEYCLEEAGLRSIDELDAVIFYEKPILKLFRVLETLLAGWPRSIGYFTQRLPPFLTTKVNIPRLIARTLPGYKGPIYFAKHHLSHAASAFYCSPFEQAAILTMDGVGERETTTLGFGRGVDIELLRAIHFPHSIGLLYSAVTAYLGFEVNDGEWKVMGLAPYGEPKYVEEFRRLLRIKPDGSFRLDMNCFSHHYSSHCIAHGRSWQKLFGFGPRAPDSPIEQMHRDLARSGQAVVEELILGLAREAKRLAASDNLVIAGGVGLNSVANWRIEQAGIFRNVWIQPASGDDGGAIGSALLASIHVYGDRRCSYLRSVALGPGFSPPEIEGFFDARRIDSENLQASELVERTADLIASGKVVGWFQGRMEFGPRALGSRSILADPGCEQMKDFVNSKIKFRESFRPFAPAVVAERAHEFFEIEPGAELPFMLKVSAVRPEKRKFIPAVTHVDGTARVQTVDRRDQPLFHSLLEAVGRRTGVPIVLNTSFNVRGEPIVATPEDAWRCFSATGLDALVIGTSIVMKPSGPVDEPALVHRPAGIPEPTQNLARSSNRKVRTNVIPVRTYFSAPAEATRVNVLSFYWQTPFNYYSNAVDTALQLHRANRIREYPLLHRYLKKSPATRILDVGCGAGWFVNSCAHHYGARATGLDANSVALKQARSVARLLPGCEDVRFVETSLFEYEPREPFQVVNSLGVLHSTHDCHAALRRVVNWIAPGGWLNLGLYHLYGRRPFLEHFQRLAAAGAGDEELYQNFRKLCPEITDETHMRSWYRDQVLHPHETQHTYEEIGSLLEAEGFRIEATSITNFKSMPARSKLIEREKQFEETSRRAIQRQGRYFPGFFVVWAQREGTVTAGMQRQEQI
jgi:carbamoyltransferase